MNRAFFVILTLIFFNITFFQIIYEFENQKPFTAFLNIGEGSSVLIANKKTVILYDTGPSGFKIIEKLRSFLPFYKKRIDLIIISHPDKDHYSGTFEIIKKYKVGALIVSPISSEESGWMELIKIATSYNIPIITIDENDEIKTPYEILLVLHPNKSLEISGKKRINENDNSLVVKLLQGGKTFLLTGDISQKIEKYLSKKYNLKVDYLLIPHHGSKYSTSKELLKDALPSMAIIQVGRNNFGHPHKETLMKLKKEKINYWRTDLYGDFVVK